MRYRVGGDGYESPVDEDDEVDGLDEASTGRVRETFDVYFAVSFGSLYGEWSVKGLSATSAEDNVDGDGTANGTGNTQDPNTAAGWRKKFLDAQRELLESQEEAKELRERILEAVL
jgi:hypothetical protein